MGTRVITESIDVREFDAFVRTNERRLARQAYALTGDLGTAQELTQEALIRAWQRWGAIRDYEFPVAWVCRTLFNLALNDRRHRRRSVVTTAVPEGRISADPVPDHLGLVAALKALPRQQCEAVVLHDAVGFTVAEVALAMGVPPGTVKSWLSRGRRAVANRLEEHPALPDRR